VVASSTTLRGSCGNHGACDGPFVGPRMIGALTRYQIGQRVRTDGPQTHCRNRARRRWRRPDLWRRGSARCCGGSVIRFVWILLTTHARLRGHRLLRRYLKLVVGNSKAWRRATVSGAVAGRAVAAYALHSLHQTAAKPRLFPFFKTVPSHDHPRFVAYAYLVIVGTSNAVNLTTGSTDSPSMPASWWPCLGVFAYATGNIRSPAICNSLHPWLGEC